MGTPYDSVNYWTPMNYDSIAADKWYQWASQTPNVNFKGANTVSQGTDTTTAQSANNVSIPVNYAQTTPDESHTGLWVTGAIGAAALIACACKGGGNPIKGAKAWYEKFFNKAGKAATDKSKNVLTKMQAVKNGNGEIKLNVPNQTKTFVGTHINAGVSEYGIKGAISTERQAFNPQTSLLNGFRLTTPNGEYKIVLKDGNPVSIVQNGKGGNILQRLTEASSDTDDGKLLAQIKNIVQELGKDKKDVNSTLLQDVKNIRFTNNFGNDTLILNICQYSDKPQLRALRTLKQFDTNDVVVQQYKPSSTEKIFINEITKKTGIPFLTRKNILIDGVNVISIPQTEIAGAKCFFEGDKIVKIINGGIPYEADSIGFARFIQENEKAIEKFRKDVFVDKIFDKIPVGSVIA